MVSYVLNDNPNMVIPEDTRRRVLQAMRELGYKPNRAARSLRTQRTNLIGVVVPDIEAYDRFYKKLIAEVPVYDVSSSFAMEQIKYTTALPLGFS